MPEPDQGTQTTRKKGQLARTLVPEGCELWSVFTIRY